MKRWHLIALLVCSPALLFAQLSDPNSPNINNSKLTVVDAPPPRAESDSSASTEAQSRPSPDDPRFTVSVTSLEAPEKARQAFDKGVQEARKGKWQAAADYFKKAVDMYPRYAVAWLELGRVKSKQSSYADAQQCFRQAVAQEPKLLDGYVELAYVAVKQNDWNDLADATNQLITLAPTSSAQYWFLNSAAYYNMGNLDKAQGSVERGIQLDSRHEFAQLEYLYGLILGSRKQYKAAAEHVATYIKLEPNAQDSQAARNMLAGYEYRAQLAQSELQDAEQ